MSSPVAVEQGNHRAVLEFLEAASVLVEVPDVFPAVVSDPDDAPMLHTAVQGRADVLCTRDVHFRHTAVEQLCAVHGIRILDDISLIQELRRSSAR